MFKCKTPKHPGAVSKKELNVQRGTRNSHAFIKMLGTETASRPDARECIMLSCRNKESSLWTPQFREGGRGTQITLKPVTIAVSRTHCHSLAKQARLLSKMGGDTNISRMGQGSCRFFCIARPSYFGLPQWRMITETRRAFRLWCPAKGQADYYSFCVPASITTLSCQGTGSLHPSFLENIEKPDAAQKRLGGQATCMTAACWCFPLLLSHKSLYSGNALQDHVSYQSFIWRRFYQVCNTWIIVIWLCHFLCTKRWSDVRVCECREDAMGQCSIDSAEQGRQWSSCQLPCILQQVISSELSSSAEEEKLKPFLWHKKPITTAVYQEKR